MHAATVLSILALYAAQSVSAAPASDKADFLVRSELDDLPSELEAPSAPLAHRRHHARGLIGSDGCATGSCSGSGSNGGLINIGIGSGGITVDLLGLLHVALSTQEKIRLDLAAAIKVTETKVKKLNSCGNSKDRDAAGLEVKAALKLQLDLLAKLKDAQKTCGEKAKDAATVIGLDVKAKVEATIKLALQLEVQVKAALDVSLGAALNLQAELRAKLDAAIKATLQLIIIARTTPSYETKCKLEESIAIQIKIRAELDLAIKACTSLIAKLGLDLDVLATVTALIDATLKSCDQAEKDAALQVQAYLKVAVQLAIEAQAKVKAETDAQVKIALELIAKLNKATDVAVKASIKAQLDACLALVAKLQISLTERVQLFIKASAMTGVAVDAQLKTEVFKTINSCRKVLASGKAKLATRGLPSAHAALLKAQLDARVHLDAAVQATLKGVKVLNGCGDAHCKVDAQSALIKLLKIQLDAKAKLEKTIKACADANVNVDATIKATVKTTLSLCVAVEADVKAKLVASIKAILIAVAQLKLKLDNKLKAAIIACLHLCASIKLNINLSALICATLRSLGCLPLGLDSVVKILL